MDQNQRLEALDERNWVYNGTNFPSIVFLAHYYPYSLINARNILSKRDGWTKNEDNNESDQILKELHQTTPNECFIKPRDIEIAMIELEAAKEVAKALGSNGAEVGSGCDQEWNPFRKDVTGEFDVMHFLRDCGIGGDYLNSNSTDVKSTLKQFIEFFNELLSLDGELLNVNGTLQEAISALSAMDDDVQYKTTITGYLSALSILYKHSGNVYFTLSGIYTSRGINARFLFAYKQETNTVLGCFQVLYQS